MVGGGENRIEELHRSELDTSETSGTVVEKHSLVLLLLVRLKKKKRE